LKSTITACGEKEKYPANFHFHLMKTIMIVEVKTMRFKAHAVLSRAAHLVNLESDVAWIAAHIKKFLLHSSTSVSSAVNVASA